MDPHSFSKLDPDPRKVNADPKHCLELSIFLCVCGTGTSVGSNSTSGSGKFS
jgi:hypothetical protein